MKSYNRKTHSKHTGIRLAAAVSSAIMMAPVAMGTVSTFADASTPAVSTTASSSYDATVAAVVSSLYSDFNTLQSYRSSAAFSKLSAANQSIANSTYTSALTLLTSTGTLLGNHSINGSNYSSIVSQLSNSDTAVRQVNDQLKSLMGTTGDASALATLRTQQSNFATAYYKLTLAQQISTNGKALLNAIQTAAGMVNSGSVTQDQATSIINNMNDYLKAINGTSLTATTNQQDAINAATAAKKEYSIVPVFLQGSSQYKKLGDLIDANADSINDKNLSDVSAEQIAQAFNSATAAMKSLVKASVVYSGVGTILYPKNYGIQVWTIGGKMVKNSNGTAKKLKGGTKWKVFGPILNINGSKMYNLGGDQFIDANYVSFAAKK